MINNKTIEANLLEASKMLQSNYEKPTDFLFFINEISGFLIDSMEENDNKKIADFHLVGQVFIENILIPWLNTDKETPAKLARGLECIFNCTGAEGFADYAAFITKVVQSEFERNSTDAGFCARYVKGLFVLNSLTKYFYRIEAEKKATD